MKIDVKVIDNHGFIHFETGKSKAKVIAFIKLLAKGTSATWTKPNEVWISQQYVKVT